MDYLESVRRKFLTDSRINGHQILREYEDVEESYIRAHLTLADESFLEFSEYIKQGTKNEIKIIVYRFVGEHRILRSRAKNDGELAGDFGQWSVNRRV
jgi:hypothetical protein